MTDKEKAKAYDRAIEVMRQWIAPCHDKKQLEVMKCSVFPELRESEDERIRKYLIEELKAAKSVGELKFIIPQPTREECIAYLEKQKESTWTDEDESFVKHILPRILNPDKWTMDQVEGDRERLKEFIDRQKCKWLEKHKDNKSAPRVLPCSAAWFEDGEEEQKEQKPAEWSEEDKDMLNSCISSIEEAKENRYAYKETDGDTSYDHEIAWLKSLRPSWKPSEEQMEALKKAVNKLAKTDVADSVRLSIMFDNLKKLM